MLPRIEAAAPGREWLRASALSNLEFMAAHPLAANERELGTRFDHARAARPAGGARRSGACPLGSGKA